MKSSLALYTAARTLRSFWQRPQTGQGLGRDILHFVRQELGHSLQEILTTDPPPTKVFGEPIGGFFTWSSLLTALARYQKVSGKNQIAGHDLDTWIIRLGLIEAPKGRTFAQLAAAEALWMRGPLAQNPLWRKMTEAQQKQWKSLLDVNRFFNLTTGRLKEGLPENYIGVAAQLASITLCLGLPLDHRKVKILVERAAQQLLTGTGLVDDEPPVGRYDRYTMEYARFVWQTAERLNDQELLSRLRPAVLRNGALWWDLFSPVMGHSTPYGRSRNFALGDTLETCAFFAAHPDLSPVPLEDLAAAFALAWSRFVDQDYDLARHRSRYHDPGRATYAYIGANRLWSTGVGMLGKAVGALGELQTALEKQGIQTIPAQPKLSPVNRYETFAEGHGVWLVRQGPLQFALPIVGSFAKTPATSDYLPVPHGLSGFAVPVQQQVPALVPFLELEDRRIITAVGRANEIEVLEAGTGLRVVWQEWQSLKGEGVTLGLKSEVRWTLVPGGLVRTETLYVTQPLRIRRWRVWVPTTHSHVNASATRFFSEIGGDLGVNIQADWTLQQVVRATAHHREGRGALGPIPLILELEASHLVLLPDQSYSWRLALNING